MLTVALVGGDGAGKTSIANILEKSYPISVKYLYMGPSILSSNKILPTSRLARFLKLHALRKDAEKVGQPLPESVSSHDFHYKPMEHSAIWLTLRLINRIAEAWYRKILSLTYQLRGYIVVYDRFFLFDVPSPSSNSKVWNSKKLVDRLEYWFFNYCYPKPKLIIFLDASPDVLYRRKGEADITYLTNMRAEILERGKTMGNFIRVDADQPLEKVLAEVTHHITNLGELKKN